MAEPRMPVTTRLLPEDYEALREKARQEDLSIAQAIEQAVKDWLKKQAAPSAR